MKNTSSPTVLSAVPMVEVFKTSVQTRQQASQMIDELLQHFPGLDIHFDLEDCDRILRVAGEAIDPAAILAILHNEGFKCSVLED